MSQLYQAAADLPQRLRGRVRHGLLLQEILDLMSHVGLKFSPYVLFEEGVDLNRDRVPPPDSFRVGPIGRQNVHEISQIAERHRPLSYLMQRLERGDVAVGVWSGDELVGYSWSSLDQFLHAPLVRTLEETEAYCYDAYVKKAYRGMAIAPCLRAALYEELASRNRYRLYSVSLFFNRSARRFKEKLGARALQLRLGVCLFRRWSFDVRLRSYEQR